MATVREPVLASGKWIVPRSRSTSAHFRFRFSPRRQPDSPNAHYILAMGLGHLGRRDEARAAHNACERLHPGFAIKRADWQPYPEPAKNKHLRNGLRKAGLPN